MSLWDQMAVAALPYWGGAVGMPVLVKARENVVFRLTLRGGREAALRLHRPGYQSRNAIEAELVWTTMLAGGGMPVPPAVPTLRGALTARVGDRVASMVEWLDGGPIGAAERPLGGTVAEQRALMGRVGSVVARLHNATDDLSLPGTFERPHWDEDGFLGDRPLWGRFWENPALGADDRAMIEDARAVARGLLADCRHARTDFGLIHADVLRENLLLSGDRLSLIDFDDSGWGWRLYDLATAVFQSLEEPTLPDIVAGLVEGYRAFRPLSEQDEARLPLFVMLRCFASAGWIASRAAPDDPQQGLRAGRALRLAADVLRGSSPWQVQ